MWRIQYYTLETWTYSTLPNLINNPINQMKMYFPLSTHLQLIPVFVFIQIFKIGMKISNLY